jgi:N-formylglutamate amidohydrolase
MVERFWREERADGPVVAVAVHHGHEVREEMAELLALSDADRFREEDPYTGDWTVIAPTRVINDRSRFEVDLNRPRGRAVYRTPDDAWGLQVWKREPPESLLRRSLVEYDAFYTAMRGLLTQVERDAGRFVVYDLHTYNHRRGGPEAPPADPEGNPQVNVGTGTLDRGRWGTIVERFMTDLREYEFPGGRLDVRENVKFRGGHFSRWVHETFPASGCALAIEFKKFFMDEWTGEPHAELLRAIGDALRSTVPGVVESLARL